MQNFHLNPRRDNKQLQSSAGLYSTGLFKGKVYNKLQNDIGNTNLKRTPYLYVIPQAFKILQRTCCCNGLDDKWEPKSIQ